MALKSMTGYGRGSASVRGIKADVELNSVNRKQFDARLSLPRGAAALESRILEAIHQQVSRGQVTGEVVIHFTSAARARGVVVDADLAGAYLRALRRAAVRLRLRDDLNASQMLALPEVVRYHHPQEDASVVWPAVAAALRIALGALLRMRTVEGAALARDMTSRFSRLACAVRRIRRHAPGVTARYRAALLQRLAGAGLRVGDGDQQLLKELALFAERSDIAEELTRLESHLTQARKALGQVAPVGRTLDFIVQEMFREITTIGSKANAIAISREAIAFKAELERIREQVQNVE